MDEPVVQITLQQARALVILGLDIEGRSLDEQSALTVLAEQLEQAGDEGVVEEVACTWRPAEYEMSDCDGD